MRLTDQASGTPARAILPRYPHEPSLQGQASLANIWPRAQLLRHDIRANLNSDGFSATGLKMDLLLRLVRRSRQNEPLSGAAVYVWHCDAKGDYSVYGRSDVDYLRGIGISDSNGRVRFTTIFPGTYLGREPHIHFEVYPSVSAVSSQVNCLLRSRILFPEAVSREIYKSTPVYRSSLKRFASLVFGRPQQLLPDPERRSQVALVSGNARTAVRASITINLAN